MAPEVVAFMAAVNSSLGSWSMLLLNAPGLLFWGLGFRVLRNLQNCSYQNLGFR